MSLDYQTRTRFKKSPDQTLYVHYMIMTHAYIKYSAGTFCTKTDFLVLISKMTWKTLAFSA